MRKQNRNDLEWQFVATHNGKVTNDGCTFTNTSRPEWSSSTRGTIGWDEGVHTWTVKLTKKSYNISVGVCREYISFSDLSKNDCIRYDCYCGDGSVVGAGSNGINGRDYFNDAFEVGDTIGVYLDLDNHYLTFSKNGRYLPVTAFMALPGGPWFPYFCFEEEGAEVQLIETTTVGSEAKRQKKPASCEAGQHKLQKMVPIGGDYIGSWYCDECGAESSGASLHCINCKTYDRCLRCNDENSDFDDIVD